MSTKKKILATALSAAMLCGSGMHAMALEYKTEPLIQDPKPTISEQTEYAIVLDIDMVLPQKAVVKNGVVMVPMRAVAETLGCNVTWDEATQQATMKNAKRTMSVTIDQDLYASAATSESGLIGMTSPVQLGCAPYVDDTYRTWIPAKAFDVMVGYTVSIDDTNKVLTIDPVQNS